jgi:tRNA modification GTPase
MGELGIDFADQDVEELSLPALKTRTREILDRLHVFEASFERGNKIQSGVRAAFVGCPNAGKSSFFNALLGEERSIVSEQAGTTRDVVRETMALRNGDQSVTLRFEDTAGIREHTSDAIEREGIDRSIRSARDADIILLVVDLDGGAASLPATDAVWSAIGRPVEKTVAILTKRDRVNNSQLAEVVAAIEKSGIKNHHAVSSVTGVGVSEAARGIVEFCQRFTRRAPGEILLTRLDHLQAVQATIVHLERALESTEEDLFAADLRQALVALGPVIGETLPDDILGRIFSEFCIGK